MVAINLRIVRAGDSERDDVLGLLAEYLPGTPVDARHDWLYVRNPHGRALTLVAYDARSGEPAGLTSLFPRWVSVGGRHRFGAIGGDGFVRPEFRRMGVATALHARCLEGMREDGIEFMFGPPEPHNLRALVRAGSRVVTQVRRYARPVSVQRIAGLFRSFRPRLVPIERAGRRALELLERTDPSSVMPIRDRAFYDWRFRDSPTRAQEAFAVMDGEDPLAICAIERQGRRVALVDLVAHPGRYAAAADAVALACRAETAVVQLNAAGPGASSLWRAGFVGRETKPFQVFAPAGVADERLFDSARWYYTWGDGDLDQVL